MFWVSKLPQGAQERLTGFRSQSQDKLREWWEADDATVERLKLAARIGGAVVLTVLVIVFLTNGWFIQLCGLGAVGLTAVRQYDAARWVLYLTGGLAFLGFLIFAGEGGDWLVLTFGWALVCIGAITLLTVRLRASMAAGLAIWLAVLILTAVVISSFSGILQIVVALFAAVVLGVMALLVNYSSDRERAIAGIFAGLVLLKLLLFVGADAATIGDSFQPKWGLGLDSGGTVQLDYLAYAILIGLLGWPVGRTPVPDPEAAEDPGPEGPEPEPTAETAVLTPARELCGLLYRFDKRDRNVTRARGAVVIWDPPAVNAAGTSIEEIGVANLTPEEYEEYCHREAIREGWEQQLFRLTGYIDSRALTDQTADPDGFRVNFFDSHGITREEIQAGRSGNGPDPTGNETETEQPEVVI